MSSKQMSAVFRRRGSASSLVDALAPWIMLATFFTSALGLMLSPAPTQLRVATPAAVTPVRMQTIAPERTKPSDLPTTWEVPDTFVVSAAIEREAAVDHSSPRACFTG